MLLTDPTGKCTSWVIDAMSNAFGGAVRGDCQYQGWANIPNNLQEGIEYDLGLAGVERDTNGKYDIVGFVVDKNPILGSVKQTTNLAQQAATLASDPAARAATWEQVQYGVNPRNWPGMFWRGVTRPFKDFITGFTCDDNYLLGRGTLGIGNEIVAVAGLAEGGVALRNWLRPTPGEVTYVDPAQLRWTQRTAGGRGRADILRQSMAERGYVGEPIDVVSTSDGLVTVDHTRAAVALELGIEQIPVRVHLPNEPLPASMIGRFGNATTWAEAAAYRAANQRPPLPPRGTTDPPRLPKAQQ